MDDHIVVATKLGNLVEYYILQNTIFVMYFVEEKDSNK